LPVDAVEKIKQMLAGDGDGDLLLTHKGDRRLVSKKATYVNVIYVVSIRWNCLIRSIMTGILFCRNRSGKK
jgi:hypothetical protein